MVKYKNKHMAKEYKKVIIAIIALVLIVGAGIFIYYLKNRPSQEMRDLLFLPEGAVLTEEQQLKYDTARTVLEENFNNGSALIAIAQIKYELSDLDGAVRVYLKALEFRPDDIVILNNLGDIYNQKEEYEQAAKMYLTIIKTNPKWINSYRELSSIYFYNFPERYAEMEGLLLNGLEKTKEFDGEAPVDFYSMLAVFYDRTENMAKAIEYYEKVIELTPENQTAKMRLEELKKL
jgi:tetratricopeptide (TPR) repeat protein